MIYYLRNVLKQVVMKRLFIITTVILITTIAFGQKWNGDTICSTDTLVVHPRLSMKYNPDTPNPNQKPYKMVECWTRSNIGLRMELGFSNYYYGERTKSWMGQHVGPNFSFSLAVDKLNFGVRFKPWTIEPAKEMVFVGQTLPTNASFNNIRFDYYVGYSLDFNNLISLEPYAGYNRTMFILLNEKDVGHDVPFKNTGGLIVGATLNKYFKIKDYEYLSLFGSAGYGFVNYEKVHPDLDNGYFEWTLGIAVKLFMKKNFNRRVE